jgi:hypothetical protein
MDIKPIRIRPVKVSPPETLRELPPPIVSSLNSPLTINIGLPIVDMPGCVEARNSINGSGPKIFGDDPKGIMTLCGAGVPSYNAPNFEPNQMTLTGPPKTPPVEPTPKTPSVKTPEVKPPLIPPIECPTLAQQAKEPIGTFVNGFREEVIGYKLLGNECVQITEPVSIPEQIIAGLPSGGQVTQVGGIAVIATSSALLAKPLADILLKVVKPTVKKVIKKIAAIRGKQSIVESVQDRRGQQRIRSHAIRKLKGKE